MFESLKPHLAELRQRLAYSVLAVFVGFAVAFTFHNTILSWITQPLNDALIQVGKIVETRNKAHWKITSPTAASTEANTSSAAALAGTSARHAAKLAQSLEKASALLQGPRATPRERELGTLLHQAARSAFALQRSDQRLRQMLASEANLSGRELLKESSFNGMITTHQVGGAFFVALKVSFFAGLLLALPVILWQIWLFVAPGLYENEKRMVLPFVLGGSLMFLLGVLFAYYVVTPFGFRFLITFGSFLYTPLINIEDYVGFFTKIMLGFGLAFELPIFAYFLALLGLITDRTLIHFFKYAIVLIFLIAALLTPPDVLTQLLMAAPLIALYGLSILIVRFVNPERPEEPESEKRTHAYEADAPDDEDFGDEDFDALEENDSSREG